MVATCWSSWRSSDGRLITTISVLRGRYVEPEYPLFCPLSGDFTDGAPVGIMIARYTEEPHQTIDDTAALAGAIMLRNSSSGSQYRGHALKRIVT
jgi:hypothetical protein